VVGGHTTTTFSSPMNYLPARPWFIEGRACTVELCIGDPNGQGGHGASKKSHDVLRGGVPLGSRSCSRAQSPFGLWNA
jgi:hypothetical protein